jgi:tetrahydromethanopterin S-methyltransferase subunit B
MTRYVANKLPFFFVLLAFAASLNVAQIPQDSSVEINGLDITALNNKINEAEATANGATASASDKLTVANLYMRRANVFYNAGQPRLYKFALGDFRRVLRLQPDNAEAREKADTIVSIYESMSRPVPNNGAKAVDEVNAITFKLNPRLIEFPSDKKIAIDSGTASKDVSYVYELELPAKRQTYVLIKSNKGDVTFSIYHLRNESSAPIISDAKTWSGFVPESGTYLIKVSSTKDDAEYQLRISLRPQTINSSQVIKRKL